MTGNFDRLKINDAQKFHGKYRLEKEKRKILTIQRSRKNLPRLSCDTNYGELKESSVEFQV